MLHEYLSTQREVPWRIIIAAWVATKPTATTVDGVTMHDLTK
jgi:hypothetical protein